MASSSSSRHRQDFDIIAFLGSGAFGEVYKVRNRIDNQLYALKRIKIADGARKRERILREAVLLSSLSHQRITRYYNCWIEQIEEELPNEEAEAEAGAAGRGGRGKKTRAATAAAATAAAATGAAATGGQGQGQGHVLHALHGLHSDSIFARTGEAFSTYGDDEDGDDEEDGDNDDGARDNDDGASGNKDSTAAAAQAPAAAAASEDDPAVLCTCNICSRTYQDWEVRTDEWGLLNASLRPLSLCTQCYTTALGKLGLDLSRVTISIRSSTTAGTAGTGTTGGGGGGGGAGTPLSLTAASGWGAGGAVVNKPKKRTVVHNMLFIQTELCDRTLYEECASLAEQDREKQLQLQLTQQQQQVQLQQAALSPGGSLASPVSPSPVSPGAPGGARPGGAGATPDSPTPASPSPSPSPAASSSLPLSAGAQAAIWHLFWQIVEGLAYLHSAGVIHRDLKGSNVFASGPVGAATVKIGDLGLATTIAPDRSNGAATGAAAATGGEAATSAHGSSSSSSGDVTASPIAASGTAASVLVNTGAPVIGGLHSVAETDDDDDDEEDEEAGAGAGGKRNTAARTTRTNTNGATRGAVRGRTTTAAASPAATPAAATAAAATAAATAATDHSATASHRASRGVGTLFYMAPEALEGRYSDKSDMFSLGVVFYSMWSNFKSSAERVRLLEALRNGSVPKWFTVAYSAQTQLISNLMQADASKRPSAAELLRYRYFIGSPQRPLGPGAGPGAGGHGGHGGHGHGHHQHSQHSHGAGPHGGQQAGGRFDGGVAALLDGAAAAASASAGGGGGVLLPPHLTDVPTLRSLLSQALHTIREQNTVIEQLRRQLAVSGAGSPYGGGR